MWAVHDGPGAGVVAGMGCGEETGVMSASSFPRVWLVAFRLSAVARRHGASSRMRVGMWGFMLAVAWLPHASSVRFQLAMPLKNYWQCIQ